MEDCRYCDASLKSEEALLSHVADEHPEEMGEIERRRLRELEPDSLGRRTGVYAGIAASVVVAAVFFYYLLSGGATEVVQPTDRGAVEEYGTIQVVVDGEPVNLTRDTYLEADQYWYLHPDTVEEVDDGYVWEKRGRDVTLEYALLTLGVDVGEDPSNASYVDQAAEVEFDETPPERTFDRSDGDTVEVTVDGTEVDPREYRLQGADSVEDVGDGDHVEVVLEASG